MESCAAAVRDVGGSAGMRVALRARSRRGLLGLACVGRSQARAAAWCWGRDMVVVARSPLLATLVDPLVRPLARRRVDFAWGRS